jgi:sucrose-phosphate synthase
MKVFLRPVELDRLVMMCDSRPHIAAFYEDEGEFPHATTGHYGDGGLAAARPADLNGVTFATFTAHSLGAQKIDGLLLQDKDLSHFNFEQRISAERWSMNVARRIITSSDAEREEQYSHPLYLGAIDVQRDAGRFISLPPGVNLEIFGANRRAPEEARTLVALEETIGHDIPPRRRHLPIVIAAGRLDAKKNHIMIVRAFAECPYLRRDANLLLLLKGGKNAFRALNGEELILAQTIKRVVNSAGMDGQCVIVPGLANRQTELAAIFRHLGRTRQGIFCLMADFEPMGLMPLEAMAAGVPAVITENSGLKDNILESDGHFSRHFSMLLVDPKSPHAIADALHHLAVNQDSRLRLREAGQRWVLRRFMWDRTAIGYRDAALAEACQRPGIVN